MTSFQVGGKGEASLGMQEEPLTQEEGGVAMGTGFINIYSKLNENIINVILSLSLYLYTIKTEAAFYSL